MIRSLADRGDSLATSVVKCCISFVARALALVLVPLSRFSFLLCRFHHTITVKGATHSQALLSCVLPPYVFVSHSLLVIGVPALMLWSFCSFCHTSFLTPVTWRAALHPRFISLHCITLGIHPASHLPFLGLIHLQCCEGNIVGRRKFLLQAAQVGVHSFSRRVVSLVFHSFIVHVFLVTALHYYNVIYISLPM